MAWGAIGARTVESQVHRQLASGLSMPIGMKNRPDGSIATAIDAINAAAAPHVFPGIDFSGTPAILHTTGNPDCHLVLRGGGGKPELQRRGRGRRRSTCCARPGLPERLVIDCSHGNSNKDHLRQPIVADDVAGQLEAGQHGISGVMLESFLVPGRQDLGGELTYGQSVTDACMGWEPTVGVLERLAAAAAKRRAADSQAAHRYRHKGRTGAAVESHRVQRFRLPEGTPMTSTLPVPPMVSPPPPPRSHPPRRRSGRGGRRWSSGVPTTRAWVRPSLLALLVLTGVLYLWGLGALRLGATPSTRRRCRPARRAGRRSSSARRTRRTRSPSTRRRPRCG